MSYKRSFAMLLATLMLLLLFTGCKTNNPQDLSSSTGEQPNTQTENSLEQSSGSTASTTSSTIISIAISENMTELDPLNQATLPGKAVMNMIFDTLISSDHEGNYNPALAESWEVSEDGLIWTFKLRQDVTFHNGEKFDSADVVCTFQRLLDNNETLIYATQYWPMLQSVKAIDPYTAEITITKPSSMTLMSLASTSIIPDEAFNEFGEKLFTEQKLPGTGPWVFDEWVDGQYLHLTRNDSYWNGKSEYDEVYVRFIIDPSAAVNAHVAGTVNAYINTGGVNNDMLPLYAGTEDRIELITKNCGTFLYMGMQCERAFKDINVRRALEYAIDRQSIMDNIFGGGALPNSFMTENTFGYDSSLANYEYNPDKARQCLEQSSYNGEEIVLSSNVATLKSEMVLLAASSMLNEVGFNTKVSIVEGATLLDMRSTGNYDVFMVTWSHNFSDPFMFLNQRILLDVHHTNLVNEEINDLIVKSNTEMNSATRETYLREIAKLAREQSGPYFPILEVQSTFAVDKDLKGIDIWNDGTYDFRNVGF